MPQRELSSVEIDAVGLMVKIKAHFEKQQTELRKARGDLKERNLGRLGAAPINAATKLQHYSELMGIDEINKQIEVRHIYNRELDSCVAEIKLRDLPEEGPWHFPQGFQTVEQADDAVETAESLLRGFRREMRLYETLLEAGLDWPGLKARWEVLSKHAGQLDEEVTRLTSDRARTAIRD